MLLATYCRFIVITDTIRNSVGGVIRCFSWIDKDTKLTFTLYGSDWVLGIFGTSQYFYIVQYLVVFLFLFCSSFQSSCCSRIDLSNVKSIDNTVSSWRSDWGGWILCLFIEECFLNLNDVTSYFSIVFITFTREGSGNPRETGNCCRGWSVKGRIKEAIEQWKVQNQRRGN